MTKLNVVCCPWRGRGRERERERERCCIELFGYMSQDVMVLKGTYVTDTLKIYLPLPRFLQTCHKKDCLQ